MIDSQLLSLEKPSEKYEASYRSYIRELGSDERYPFPLDYPCDDFAAMLQRLSDDARGINLPDGFVRNTTFWLIENNEIVGVSNVRHEMTDRLKLLGGHIGLGVRPTAQGRGVGKELMRRTLEQAARLGIAEAFITCHKSNRASAGVIVANGGILDAEYSVPEYDEPLQRYVVDLRACASQP